MAGLKGNVAWLGAGIQTGRAVIPTTPTDRYPFSGGSIGPTRNTNQLSETDSTRNQGTTYVESTAVEGSPEVYARDSNIHHLLQYVLGTKVTTGATNFTHTLTPANSLPYVTFWRMLGDTLWERFEDNLVSELTISADAGSPLTAAATIMGRKAIRLTSDPASGWPAVASDTVYNFNDAAVTLAGSATSLVGSFEATISNNVSVQQTDDSVPYDVVPGLFTVTLGFDLIFETLDEYNRFHYLTVAGTTQGSTVPTVAANFTFSHGVNNSINFDFPAIVYEEFPVDPDPGGDAIVASVRARAVRSGSPFLTAVVKNQAAA